MVVFMVMVTVACPVCKFKVFDKGVIKALVIRPIDNDSFECRCKRCKGDHWIELPLVYKNLQSA